MVVKRFHTFFTHSAMFGQRLAMHFTDVAFLGTFNAVRWTLGGPLETFVVVVVLQLHFLSVVHLRVAGIAESGGCRKNGQRENNAAKKNGGQNLQGQWKWRNGEAAKGNDKQWKYKPGYDL